MYNWIPQRIEWIKSSEVIMAEKFSDVTKK